ncbi:LysR substrate-binding domain-containing protein [Pseudoroseomonas wenyumeiae]
MGARPCTAGEAGHAEPRLRQHGGLRAILLAGDADFLLCHHHHAAPARFAPEAFDSVVVGHDRLLPLSAPDADGAPHWRLSAGPARLLAYSAPSGLGRILEATQRPALETVFTSPLAAALLTMARQGQGIAWLPASLAAEDLAAGRLLEAGEAGHAVPVEIRLFRPRRRQSPVAEAFWRAARD